MVWVYFDCLVHSNKFYHLLYINFLSDEHKMSHFIKKDAYLNGWRSNLRNSRSSSNMSEEEETTEEGNYQTNSNIRKRV